MKMKLSIRYDCFNTIGLVRQYQMPCIATQWYVVKSDESCDEIGNFKGNFFQNLTWQKHNNMYDEI